MPYRNTQEELADTKEAYRIHETITATAKALGVARATVWRRLHNPQFVQKPFEAEYLPSPDSPVEEILERRKREFARVHEAKTARKLINVDVRLDGPVGIAHFGDPHVDDPGTDIALLESHVNIVNKTEGLFGANVGDQQNLWVGRLARLYGEQSTSARESWALTEWLVSSVHWLYIISGNHDCLDMQTQALTKSGWKFYSEIEDTDEIYSVDNATGLGTWTSWLLKTQRPNTESMVKLEARGLSMRMTPKHRVMLSVKGQKKEWQASTYTPASELPVRFRISTSKSAELPDYPLSDAQIALTGWLLTDGHIRWRMNSPRMYIYQSKDGSKIESLLDTLGLVYSKTTRHRNIEHICGKALKSPPLPQVEYILGAREARKILEWVPCKGKLPDWALDLSDHQFEVLLQALIAGDGSWASNGQGNSAVIHGKKSFLDSVQAAAVCHGWRAWISVAREKDYRLNVCRNPDIQVDKQVSVTESDPSPNVWCLTVPYGNFMVRRNGCAYFTGNCWTGANDPLQWIMRQQPSGGLYEAHGARLNLRFPNGREVRCNARHDFAGHSMWNPVHGPSKAAQMGWRDHILTCGHKHTAGYAPIKDPASGLLSHAIRVASYKTHDRYADEKGLPDQNFSANICTVIDPDAADEADLVTVFFSVEVAAEFLTWKRGRRLVQVVQSKKA